jgi:hypothetical protein
MKVSSTTTTLTLLDMAIGLVELLNLMLDDWETIMKDSLCNNTLPSRELQSLP